MFRYNSNVSGIIKQYQAEFRSRKHEISKTTKCARVLWSSSKWTRESTYFPAYCNAEGAFKLNERLNALDAGGVTQFTRVLTPFLHEAQ